MMTAISGKPITCITSTVIIKKNLFQVPTHIHATVKNCTSSKDIRFQKYFDTCLDRLGFTNRNNSVLFYVNNMRVYILYMYI